MRQGLKSVQLKIEKLTDDEDKRQELWLHYVSGNCVNSLTEKLAKVEHENMLQEKFRNAVADMYRKPPTETTVKFLGNFTDFERSIIFLLLLGFSVHEVAEYKGISYTRIKQSIVAISKHSAWEEYGTQT